jgi:hypothetical protein
MPISSANGTITTSVSEQTLYDITAEKQYATWLFFHNMTGTDIMAVKVYVKDDNAAVLRIYENRNVAVADVTGNPAIYIPPVITSEYKVTIQRTAGSDRAVTWKRLEVT